MMRTDITASALLGLYNDLGKSFPALPPMERDTYGFITEPKSERLETADAALERLRRFKPTQGWMSCQSVNLLLDGPDLPETNEQTGSLLSAEACNADGASLHLRYDGADSWCATEYRPTPGGPYLADIVTQVAYKVPLGRYLRYRRFWRVDAAQGAQVFAACFIGFGDDR